MRQARVWPVLLLLLLTLTMVACAAQPSQGQVPDVALSALDTAASILPRINLPRIVLEYDQEGVPSILGIKATAIQPFVGFLAPGVDLRVLNMRKDYVEWFTRSNLQHIEIEHNSDGLFLYANGKPLPHIAWDEEALDNAGDVAAMLGVQYAPIIDRLLPILGRVGINVVFQFPVAEGSQRIAYRERGSVSEVSVTEVAEPSAVIHLAVEYGDDGLPRMFGISSRDLGRLLGVNLRGVELPPGTVARLKAVNLQSVQLQTRPDGLRLLVNGKTLPYLAYSEEELNNAIDLYQQLFPAQEQTGEFLRQVLMMIQQADVDLTVRFPAE